MSAFSDRKYDHLCTRIGELAKLALSWRRCTLDHDDLRELFVRSEDRVALSRCAELIPPIPFTRSFTLEEPGRDDVRVTLASFGSTEHRFLFPAYNGAALQFIPDAIGSKAHEKFMRNIQAIVETKLEWAIVGKVMWELQVRCDSPTQLRALFPAIATLFGPAEEFRSDVERLGPPKAVKDLPSLSVAFRRACAQAAGTVTKASMLPTDKTPPGNKQVSINSVETKLMCPWGDYAMEAVI